MAMRRSASEPISQIASAIMSAAKATGSAWKLPPDSAVVVLGEDQRIVGDAVGLVASVARGLAQQVERGAHHLRLAAQAIGVLHALVADEMRGADRAARHQRAQAPSATSIWPRWPRSAWMRGSNGVSEPRAASVDSAPVTSADCEQSARLRTGRRARSAVENCVPLSSASLPSARARAARGPRRASASARRHARRRRE